MFAKFNTSRLINVKCDYKMKSYWCSFLYFDRQKRIVITFKLLRNFFSRKVSVNEDFEMSYTLQNKVKTLFVNYINNRKTYTKFIYFIENLKDLYLCFSRC